MYRHGALQTRTLLPSLVLSDSSLMNPFVCIVQECAMFVCIVMEHYKHGDLSLVLKKQRNKPEPLDEQVCKILMNLGKEQ